MNNYPELAVVNPGTFTQPACERRLACIDLPVESSPAVTLEGTAVLATSPALRKKYGRGFEVVRVGSHELCLEHEGEPGWAPMFRLKPGTRYRVEAYRCKGSPVDDGAPYDRRSANQAVFYARARAVDASIVKDLVDQRRKVNDATAAWTDGLLLRTTGTGSNHLTPEKLYRVVVTEVPVN